jgi:hypothetical protein
MARLLDLAQFPPEDTELTDDGTDAAQLEVTVEGSIWEWLVITARSTPSFVDDSAEFPGEIIVRKDGVVEWVGPSTATTRRATPSKQFNDAGTNVPYLSVEVVGDDDTWATSVVGENAASGVKTVPTERKKTVRQWGERPGPTLRYTMNDPTDIFDLLDDLIDRGAANDEQWRPTWSFDRLLIDPRCVTNALNAAFQLDLGDLVRVKMTRVDGSIADRKAIVRRIGHAWSEPAQTWVTEFGLEADRR